MFDDDRHETIESPGPGSLGPEDSLGASFAAAPFFGPGFTVLNADGERRREENLAAWAAFHRRQAQRHRATLTDLVVFHEAQARKYMGNAHHHNSEGAA
jgi:hypothetical protein